MRSPSALMHAMQIPGLETPDVTIGERLSQFWVGGGELMYPLAACAVIGLVVIVWKVIELSAKRERTVAFLGEVDGLLLERKMDQALALARESDSPAGRILAAGLERADEGAERAAQAIERVGIVEMARLEQGMVWLATLSNVAPLLGFLGTVLGMYTAFDAIVAAQEIEASAVAGGIKIALITTATGLVIAIPINMMHNYIATRVDRLILDMEESALKMFDAISAERTSVGVP